MTKGLRRNSYMIIDKMIIHTLYNDLSKLCWVSPDKTPNTSDTPVSSYRDWTGDVVPGILSSIVKDNKWLLNEVYGPTSCRLWLLVPRVGQVGTPRAKENTIAPVDALIWAAIRQWPSRNYQGQLTRTLECCLRLPTNDPWYTVAQ